MADPDRRTVVDLLEELSERDRPLLCTYCSRACRCRVALGFIEAGSSHLADTVRGVDNRPTVVAYCAHRRDHMSGGSITKMTCPSALHRDRAKDGVCVRGTTARKRQP